MFVFFFVDKRAVKKNVQAPLTTREEAHERYRAHGDDTPHRSAAYTLELEKEEGRRSGATAAVFFGGGGGVGYYALKQ